MHERNTFQAIHVRRVGLTLIEMLVATAITLILILAVVQMFSWIGGHVSKQRAVMERNGQLRNALLRLQQDLDGISVQVVPNLEANRSLGYLEMAEGPSRDLRMDLDNLTDATVLKTAYDSAHYGDCDDWVAFTMKSSGEPFIGQLNGVTVQSNLAEVVWWVTRQGDDPADPATTVPQFTLHRRALLIRPDLAINSTDTPEEFYKTNDISVRKGSSGLVGNSLADLARRENRFGHWGFSGNTATDYTNRMVTQLYKLKYRGSRYGEDVVLSHVLAFDLKAFDPLAKVLSCQYATTSGSSGNGLTPLQQKCWDLDQALGFRRYSTDPGDYFVTYNGYNFKWIVGPGPGNTPEYYITSSGQLYSYTGTVPGTLIDTLDATVFADPSLLWNPVAPTIAASTGLTVGISPHDPKHSVLATANGTPDGNTMDPNLKWVGSGAWVDLGYAPKAYTHFGGTVTPPDPYAADRALYNLDLANNFSRYSGVTDWYASYGPWNVRWFRGDGGEYYIDSTGKLYKVVSYTLGPPAVLNGTFMADVGTNVYANPALLVDRAASPAPPPAPSPITTEEADIDEPYSMFSGVPHKRSGCRDPVAGGSDTAQQACIYDTFCLDYESDGINQDAPLGDTFGIDQGTNGVDDDSKYGTDDPAERETSPPYPWALRGVLAVIRVHEPDSQAVIQQSLCASFIK